MTEDEIREICGSAVKMRERSYAPYSHFRVGAALLGEDGKIYTGCNIENAAFTPTNCAERTAIFKAVSEGVTKFQAIAIAGGPEGGELSYCPPCGVCRQVMEEFCPKDFPIYLARSGTDYRAYILGSLLPEGFGGKNLKSWEREEPEELGTGRT